jgi:hypothetical protein
MRGTLAGVKREIPDHGHVAVHAHDHVNVDVT